MCSAARLGDLAGLRRIIDGGADPNAGDYDRRTALHLAAAEGHVELVELRPRCHELVEHADLGARDAPDHA